MAAVWLQLFSSTRNSKFSENCALKMSIYNLQFTWNLNICKEVEQLLKHPPFLQSSI